MTTPDGTSQKSDPAAAAPWRARWLKCRGGIGKVMTAAVVIPLLTWGGLATKDFSQRLQPREVSRGRRRHSVAGRRLRKRSGMGVRQECATIARTAEKW